MPEPTIPPQLAPIADRPFSFYPPILNVEHNEWRFRKATWSEIAVVNAKSDLEVWIPRRYLGEISQVEEPIMIVGLDKELQYKGGSVWPHERRVVEMPVPPSMLAASGPSEPPPSGIRRQPSNEARMGRLVLTILGAGALIILLVAIIARIGPSRAVKFTSQDQDFLSFSRNDDYFSVVRTLGQPGADHWRPKAGELQYRALWYPKRGYYVILLGPERSAARYIGTMDHDWNVVHYVDLPNGGSTAPLLRGLEKF